MHLDIAYVYVAKGGFLITMINDLLCMNDMQYQAIMAVIHLSETDNKIYGQEGMCIN